MREVCRDLAPVVQNTRPLMVSIAAGLETPTLDRWLGGHVPIVRVMPNTPALVGKGAAGLFATEEVTEDQKTGGRGIFHSIGLAAWVEDEALLHAVTALSGSGPAYFFLMLEALEAAATDAGMEAGTARQLAIQTMAGAAEMAAAASTIRPSSNATSCPRAAPPNRPFTPLRKAACGSWSARPMMQRLADPRSCPNCSAGRTEQPDPVERDLFRPGPQPASVRVGASRAGNMPRPPASLAHRLFALEE